MAAPQVPWITNAEPAAALGAATDIVNRPLKFTLTQSGMDVDNLGFTGFTPVFNVKAYLAKGDGVQNDTTFINDAITAARAAVSRPSLGSAPAAKAKTYLSVGGARVFFPNGKYKVDYLTGDFSGITFCCNGKSAAVLDGNASASATYAIIDAINAAGDTRVINFSIKDLAVWGPTGGAVSAVKVTQGYNVNLTGVTTSWGKIGFELYLGSQYKLDQCQSEQATQDGFNVFGGLTGLGLSKCTLMDCVSRDSGRHAFAILQGTSEVTLKGNMGLTPGGMSLYMYNDQQVGSVFLNHFVDTFTGDQSKDVCILIQGLSWSHIRDLWASNWTSATSAANHHAIHFVNCNDIKLNGVMSYGAKADGMRFTNCLDIQGTDWTMDDYNAVGLNIITSNGIQYNNVLTKRTGVVAASLPAGNGVCNYGIVIDAASRRIRPGPNVDAQYGAIARYLFNGGGAFGPRTLSPGIYWQELTGAVTGFGLPGTATIGTLTISNQHVSAEILMRYQISTNAAQQTVFGTLRILVVRQAGNNSVVDVTTHAIPAMTKNAAGAEAITATFGTSITGAAGATQSINITVALSSTVGATANGRFKLDSLFGLNNNADSAAAETYAVLTVQ